MKVMSPARTVSGAVGIAALKRRLGEGLSALPSLVFGTQFPGWMAFSPNFSYASAGTARREHLGENRFCCELPPSAPCGLLCEQAVSSLTLLRAVSLLRIFASLRLRGQILATSRDEAMSEIRASLTYS